MKVLCYSPQAENDTQAMREITVMHALKLRGAEIKYIVCDGVYSDCDIFWASIRPRTPMSCNFCQARVSNVFCQLGMPYEWLSRYLHPQEFQTARDWADSLAVDELLRATYKDWKIGEWVESSVHSCLRVTEFDFEQPEIIKTYRGYVYSGLLACLGLFRLMADFTPHTLFLFNGRASSTRIALELAKQRGTQVICHEVGWKLETMLLSENTDCTTLEPIHRVWENWKSVPLSKAQIEMVEQLLEDREKGTKLLATYVTSPTQSLHELSQSLHIEPNKRPLWVLFTSSDDEIAASPEYNTVFRRQLEWIQQTIDYANNHPEIDLVIRVHPNTGGKNAAGFNVAQFQQMEDLRQRLPANVRMVMPDDSINSYSLMNACTVGLIYSSTTGLEMACKGKTVVIAGGSIIGHSSFVKTVQSAESYESLLDEVIHTPIRNTSKEIQRMAYRFAYAWFFRQDIPFPLIKMPSLYGGQPAYQTLAELLPGHDPSLDYICNVILGQEPVYRIPTPQEEEQSDRDEIAWFMLDNKAQKSGTPPEELFNTQARI